MNRLFGWIMTIFIAVGFAVFLLLLGLWSMIRHPVKFINFAWREIFGSDLWIKGDVQ